MNPLADAGPPVRPTGPGTSDERVALVVPAYRARATLRDVVLAFRPYVDFAVVVDDAGGDATGDSVADLGADVIVLRHAVNRGVGGATKTGIREALRRGATIVVKVDADGQMDPEYLGDLVAPLVARAADVTKGNRWYHGAALESMPFVRRTGNLALGFLVRAATGSWRTFDPTNGYLAWRAEVLELVDLDRAEDRYRFESSMIGLLAAVGAVIQDVPIPARYEGAASHMQPMHEAPGLARFLLGALLRRVWRQYFVQDFSAVSIFLLSGVPLVLFGVGFGIVRWCESVASGTPATAGTVLLAALPTLLGFNLLVQALVLDIGRTPGVPLSRHRRPHGMRS